MNRISWCSIISIIDKQSFMGSSPREYTKDEYAAIWSILKDGSKYDFAVLFMFYKSFLNRIVVVMILDTDMPRLTTCGRR